MDKPTQQLNGAIAHNENGIDHHNKSQVSAVPQYGVKMKFNHVFPEKRTPNFRPTFRQTLPLLPLVWR